MRNTWYFHLFVMYCFGFGLPASAQLDSPALRAKFGPPLNREMFHVPAGFDLIVDYGPGHQVCTIQAPALMPAHEQVSSVSSRKRQMSEFLWDLVPLSIRGKEVEQLIQMVNTLSDASIEYEHVVVSELQNANRPLENTIVVTFKNDECRVPPGQN